MELGHDYEFHNLDEAKYPLQTQGADGSLLLPASDADGGPSNHMAMQHQSYDAAMEYDISEFFDINGAALDPYNEETSLVSFPDLPPSAANANSHHTSSSLPRAYSNQNSNVLSLERAALNNEHIPKQAAGESTKTVSLATRKRKGQATSIPGTLCIAVGPFKSHKQKRRKATEKELEESRSVRRSRACLRCYFQRGKCSEHRPCDRCQDILNKAHGSRTLEWRACVSSHLPDLNIFAYHKDLPKSEDHRLHINATWAKAGYTVWLVPASFALSFKQACPHLDKSRPDRLHQSVPGISISRLWMKTPTQFILYILEFDTVSTLLSFKVLNIALERNALASSSLKRCVSLIVNLALMLDEAIAMEISVPEDNALAEMRHHLALYLEHYLRRLFSAVFGELASPVLDLLQDSGDSIGLSGSFWTELNNLMQVPEFANRGISSASHDQQEMGITRDVVSLATMPQENGDLERSDFGIMGPYTLSIVHC